MAILGILISCREFDDFIVGYLDATLPLQQRVAFSAHFAICGTCRRYLKQYKQTMAIAKASAQPIEQVHASAPEELVQAVLRARQGGQPGDPPAR